MMTNIFEAWTLRLNAQPTEADSVAEVTVVGRSAAIAGQYRGTPMPLTTPKAAVRSPKNLTYRGTPYTR